jgi:uncharacterized protein YndB with AHSA1/START domain
VVLVVGIAGVAGLDLRADNSRLEHEVIVEAPLDQVWTAFTTKAGMESWMVAHAEIDLKVGGKMLTHYDRKGKLGDSRTIENTILSFEPKRMLSLKATKPPEGFPFPEEIKDMWSVIYFDEAGPGRTRVRAVGLGFKPDANSQQLRKFFDSGNAFTLKRLQAKFATKKSVP